MSAVKDWFTGGTYLGLEPSPVMLGQHGSRLLLGATERRRNELAREGWQLDVRGLDDKVLYDGLVWHEGPQHGVTFGATRSGKMTSAIALNLLTYRGGALVIDPKGELYGVCGTVTGGNDNVHGQTHLLDPFGIAKVGPYNFQTERDPRLVPEFVEPAHRDCYNPLDEISGDPHHAWDEADKLVSAIFTDNPGKEPFFNNMASMLLTAVVVMVACQPGYAEERHLVKVHQLLSEPADLLGAMALSYIEQVSETGRSFKALADNTRTSITAELDNQLRFLKSPKIRAISRKSTFSFKDLQDRMSRLYVVLGPGELRDPYDAWLRMLLKCSVNASRPLGAGELPVLWVVDEAKQLGSMDALHEAYNLRAGYGIRVWSFWQNLGDLRKLYPDDWTAFISNSFWQVLSCGEQEDAKYFAARWGEHQVDTPSGSRPVTPKFKGWEKVVAAGLWAVCADTTAERWKDRARDRDASTSSAKHWEPRQRAEDILHMPPDRQMVVLPGQAPVFCYKVPYYETWQGRKYSCSNRFHVAT